MTGSRLSQRFCFALSVLFVSAALFGQSAPTINSNITVTKPQQRVSIHSNAAQPVWSVSGQGTFVSNVYVAPSVIPLCSSTPIATISVTDSKTSLSSSTNVYGASSEKLTVSPDKASLRIPLKAISDSGGKAITIPDGNRSGVGAKRRWLFDVAKTDRNRQAESVRSEAKAGWSWRGWGCGARGGSPLSPPQHTVTRSADSAPNRG